MTFSREQNLKDVKKYKLLRAKTMAKSGDVDYCREHPSECASAQAPTPNYTALTLRINKKTDDFQALAQQRRNKRK